MKNFLQKSNPLLLVVLAFVLFLAMQKFTFLETFSLKYNDINLLLTKNKPSSEVVVVAIDEKSVNRFGRWPWDREIVAQGVEKLEGAQVVAFDMVFSETANGDEALAKALLRLDNSVCGFFLRSEATQYLDERAHSILQDSALDLLQSKSDQDDTFFGSNYIELNHSPILESCTMQAAFSTVPAVDTLYRYYPTVFRFKNELYPSLAIQSLRIRFNSDLDRDSSKKFVLDGKKIVVDKNGFVRLNYYGKNAFTTLSFADVYDGKVKDEVKNKIVLFGVTEMGIGDRVATPLGNMYGVYLHATFLSNFLNSELLQESKALNALFILFIFTGLYVTLLFLTKLLYRVGLYLFVYGGVFVLSKYLLLYHLLYIDMFYPLLMLLFGAIVQETFQFYLQEQDSRFLKRAFASYLSKELLHKLISKPGGLELGGEKRELTILFSDIRNFTALSEQMDDPQKLITLLNRYFTPMTECVIQNKGMLDKYIGDAVMAFFNAPVPVQEHAAAACQCALDMKVGLRKLNEELRKEGVAPIEIGIGINTGEAVVGNMGATKRFNYTVIGDSVNLASRLESTTKEFGVGIIISETTYELVKDKFLCNELGVTYVKGKKESVRVYELLGAKDPVTFNDGEKYEK